MTNQRFCPQCRTERLGQLRYCSSCAFDFAASTLEPPALPTQAKQTPMQATVRVQAQGCFSYLGFFVGGAIAAVAWLYLSANLFNLDSPGGALIWLGGAVVAFVLGGWATATQILVWLAPRR